MKTEDAAKILEALARGIDPETGELFPDDSALNSPHVIRALFLGAKALQPTAALTSEPEKRAVEAGLEQAWKPWNDAEEQQLIEAFDRGDSVQTIAEAHKRKLGGITARLVKLGRIERSGSGASDTLQAARSK